LGFPRKVLETELKNDENQQQTVLSDKNKIKWGKEVG
jgi:hypothetical protein